jgi:ADP-ribose pyrophosphatase YjhB (NUDIX family)
MSVEITRGERIGKRGRIAVGCSAAVVDPATQKILLVRRADDGGWSVPGGYMDPGESATEACAREVLEETGIRVAVGRLIGVYTSPHILLEYPDGNRWQLVLLFFAAEPVGGTLYAGDETTAARFFSREETEHLDMRALNRQRIDDAFAQRAETFIRDDFDLRWA